MCIAESPDRNTNAGWQLDTGQFSSAQRMGQSAQAELQLMTRRSEKKAEERSIQNSLGSQTVDDRLLTIVLPLLKV